MRKVLCAGFVIALALASGGVHVSAGTSEDPEITDPAGDANFISPITGDQPDTRPASFNNTDLLEVWFETAFETNKIRDPETGEILRVEYVPTDLLVHIRTQAPVRPLSPWGSLRFKVQVAVPACQTTATLELAVLTDPANDSAKIWPAPGTGCAGDPPGSGFGSPVKPSFDGAVSTATFPLVEKGELITGIPKVISAGVTLSQPSARSTVTVPTGLPADLLPVDDTAVGRNFTIGQDVPADIDCVSDPGDAECQP